MTELVGMIRDMFAKVQRDWIREFAPDYKEREDIIRYNDICYGADTHWNVCDVYRPKNRGGEKLPVLVSVHGGGWIQGDKDDYQYYCMSLAAQGFVVVNFTYRLAPHYHFPAPMEDLNTLLLWMTENEDEYGLDMEALSALGDSAGAHILGAYAAVCTNEEYASQFSFQVPQNLCFRAIALNCGVYFSNYSERRSDMIRMLVSEYLGIENTDEPESAECKESRRKVLDIFEFGAYVTEKFPVTYLMTSAEDYMKSHTLRLAEKLAEQKVEFVLRMHVSSQRELEHIFHCNLNIPEASSCNTEEVAFIKSIINRY